MTDDSFEPKLIYLTRRHPALSREGFTARWREHGALGMSRPRWKNIARYVHCDIMLPPADCGAVLSDHDGIGIIWHRSPAHRAAHIADTTSRAEMEADERLSFAEPIVNVCLIVRETVLLAPPPAGTAVKLTRFIWDGESAETAQTPSGAGQIPAMQSSLGHVINQPLPAERGSHWGLNCNRVQELWFANVPQAIEAARTLAVTDRAAKVISALSNEVELYRATSS
jgi:hypothetical protein